MSHDSQDRGPAGSARALGADLSALLKLRAELVGVEIEEIAARKERLLLLGGIAALFGAIALLLLAFLVVVLAWDTYRVAAIVAVTALYGAVSAWAFARFRAVSRDAPPPFSATLAEFRKDLEMLRGNDEPPL